MAEDGRGILVIIGGSEDKEGECAILRRFVELAGEGRDQARVVIVTSATNQPRVVGETYAQLFKTLGAGEVGILDIASRQEANAAATYEAVAGASGIFFTGGRPVSGSPACWGGHGATRLSMMLTGPGR